MKLFISWSGERSRILAESLHHWIPLILNSAEPWLSSSDINPGSRWSPDLAGQLEQTKFGIVCLSIENLDSTWIHFEAGALSKVVNKSHVVPLLLDNKPTDIKGPLAQFQAAQVTKKEILKMLAAINNAIAEEGEKGVEKNNLEEVFETLWPKLEKAISTIPSPTALTEPPERSQKDMIEEILNLVRGIYQKELDQQDLTTMTFIERLSKYFEKQNDTEEEKEWMNRIFLPDKDKKNRQLREQFIEELLNSERKKRNPKIIKQQQ
jgi:hypothetical protein